MKQDKGYIEILKENIKKDNLGEKYTNEDCKRFAYRIRTKTYSHKHI